VTTKQGLKMAKRAELRALRINVTEYTVTEVK